MNNVIPLFWAKIEKGEMVWHEKARLKEYLRLFKDGQEVEIEIRKYKKNRTLNQNAYYHGVILPLISQHTGFSNDEVCEVLRRKFLSYQKAGKDNKLHRFTRSTADLTTAEMVEYVDAVVRFSAQELGVIIPEPKQVAVDNPLAQ